MKLSKREIVLTLWGVILAFSVQVAYDIFGENPFYKSIMPKYLWGLAIVIVAFILLIIVVKKGIEMKI